MLLSQNKIVRCLIRDKSQTQPLVQAGAQTLIGDLKDPGSLKTACKDVEVVITTANSQKRGGPDNYQTVDLQGNRNLIDAAKTAGAKQFIFVSASSADPNSPVPLLQAKGKTEEYLRDSGLAYTIVAPNAFMDIWVADTVGFPAIHRRPVTLVGEGRRKHSWVSVQDVAKTMIKSVNNPKAMNKRLVVGGPEPLSFLQIIEIYERLLGRKIVVNHASPGQPIPDYPEYLVSLLPSFDMFDSPIDMTDFVRTFDIQLTSVEEFAKKMISATP